MPASAAWRRLSAIVPIVFAAVIGSTLVLAPTASAAGNPTASAHPVQHQNQGSQALILARIDHAADVAISHLGDPYRYGAAGPHAFDCSGLAMWSYDHSHMTLPRTAAGQYAAVHHIIKEHLVRGDLVFFHDSSGHVYHVGMFLYWNSEGVAVIVHAPYPGRNVIREPVWTSSWYAGTRRPV